MTPVAKDPPAEQVSRRRYERERRARKEVEALLEQKSRELYELNQALRRQASHLEEEVQRRTADLEMAKTQAEDANEAKSAFLAMISHEIRTPLNGLLGMGAALAESGLNDEQAEMAGVMQASGDTLLSLLNDILDLSKIEARQMEVERIPFALAPMLEEVHSLFAGRAREKGLDYDLQIDASVRTNVLSDPTRLRQVIANLLSNAIKFTNSGSVTLCAWIEEDMLRCQVLDTGGGVAPDQRETLFRPFAQADRSITRRFGGTGLGLAIAREMCRLMGGDLTYSPRGGGGSDFLAQVQAPPAQNEKTAASGISCAYELILGHRAWRVLAAEDNKTNQRVLALMLRHYGIVPKMVETGAAAVEAHCHDPFDIILMDVNMPEMNGLEAASFIRQFETAHDLPRVPIIALTANAMTHQVQDYLRQGIDSHVAKPVKRQVLAQEMARLLCSQTEIGHGCSTDCQADCAAGRLIKYSH